MEVPLPVVRSKFDFSDPQKLAKELEENQDGSYFQKLSEFVNSEKERLKERFMQPVTILDYNPEPYDQVWEAFSELINHSLELFWFHRFEWEDIEREALALEGMEAELEQKFSDFEREMDSLHQTTLYTSTCIVAMQKIIEMQRLLKEMVLKIHPLFKRDFGTVTRKFEFIKCNAATSHAMPLEENERIRSGLRFEIFLRNMNLIANNAAEVHKASVRLVRDILPMGIFISQWNNFFQYEALKFSELLTSPDLKKRRENSDVLEGPYHEMLLAVILPSEYYSVFKHPNRGKIPIDIR